MSATAAKIQGLEIIGGALCLDFINTVEDYSHPQPRSYLMDYDDLVAWGQRVGLLTPGRARQLGQSARAHPAQARAVLRRALALRSALYRMFAATDRKARPEALALLNENLGEALARGRLMRSENRFDWDWSGDADDLAQILHAVARSAADLLTSDLLRRVSECDSCGWLFVDRSRNHSRRWCSMDDCGNRLKARRHYQRTRTA